MKKVLLPILLALPFLSGCGTRVHYADSEKYTEFTGKVTINNNESIIKELQIDWISGEVDVQAGNEFTLSEESLKGSYKPLYYRIDNNTLDIKYCQSDIRLPSNMSKKLVVTVPYALNKLDLDVTSGKYVVELGALEEFDIDMTSGRGELKIGSMKKGEFDLTSGSISLEVLDSRLLESIDIDLTSGSFDFKYDGVKGYNLDRNGKKSSVDGSDTSLERFSIDFDCTSGSLTII